MTTLNISSDSHSCLKSELFLQFCYHLFWFNVWNSLHVFLLESYFPLVIVELYFNVMWLDNNTLSSKAGEGRFIRLLNYRRCYCCERKPNYLWPVDKELPISYWRSKIDYIQASRFTQLFLESQNSRDIRTLEVI